MSYHHSHTSSHHPSFLGAALPPINYAHSHGPSPSSSSSTSLLSNSISSHSFPIAPTQSSSSPAQQAHQHQHHHQQQQQQQHHPHATPVQQQRVQHQHHHPHPQHQQQQQQQQQQHQQHQQQQQQQQVAQQAGAAIPDTDGFVSPPSMPLELDFDTLESASNYMHTYALSQGFDIRIQWSANNQTRICWSCYRGGFPESSTPSGSPTKPNKRQVPKEKERRKRGSLKIGCPFRVQCTKNWKSGKMELRILEGRHNHQMETDRENLPSQVRRIKEQRKADEEQQVNGTAALVAVSHHAHTLLGGGNPAAAAAAAASLNILPSVHDSDKLDAENDTVALVGRSLTMMASPSSGAKPTFERNLLNLLGLWDRSDTSSRLLIEKDLEVMVQKFESKLEKNQRKKRKISHSGSNSIAATPNSLVSAAAIPMSATATPTLQSRTINNVNATTATGLPRMNGQAVIGRPHQPSPQQQQQQQHSTSLHPHQQVVTAVQVAAAVNHATNPAAAAAAAAAAVQQQQQHTSSASIGNGSSNGNGTVTDHGGGGGGGNTDTLNGKGPVKCSNCKQFGHNRRRCPMG